MTQVQSLVSGSMLTGPILPAVPGRAARWGLADLQDDHLAARHGVDRRQPWVGTASANPCRRPDARLDAVVVVIVSLVLLVVAVLLARSPRVGPSPAIVVAAVTRRADDRYLRGQPIDDQRRRVGDAGMERRDQRDRLRHRPRRGRDRVRRRNPQRQPGLDDHLYADGDGRGREPHGNRDGHGQPRRADDRYFHGQPNDNQRRRVGVAGMERRDQRDRLRHRPRRGRDRVRRRNPQRQPDLDDHLYADGDGRGREPHGNRDRHGQPPRRQSVASRPTQRRSAPAGRRRWHGAA